MIRSASAALLDVVVEAIVAERISDVDVIGAAYNLAVELGHQSETDLAFALEAARS